MSVVNYRYISRFVAAIAILGASAQSEAEYMTAPGDIAEQTNQASALLNDALSHFHLMMAAVDRKNIDLATAQQQDFISGLSTASQAFRAASEKASVRPLSPKPQNKADEQCVELFNSQAESFNLKLPASQRDIIAMASYQLEMLQKYSFEPVARMVRDVRIQQAVEARVSKATTFLNCATTVLLTGG